MRYETLQSKAWSHRTTIIATMLLIALSTIAIAAPAAQPDKYRLTYTADDVGGSVMFEVTVTEIATGKVVSQPRLTSQPGTEIRAKSGTQSDHGPNREINVTALQHLDRSGTLTLDVEEDGRAVQHTEIAYAPGQAARKYVGEPVTIDVKDADIHDILNTLGDLTGYTFDIAPDVQAKVTLTVRYQPWDRVLDDMLTAHGLEGKLEGKTVHVTKMSEDVSQ